MCSGKTCNTCRCTRLRVETTFGNFYLCSRRFLGTYSRQWCTRATLQRWRLRRCVGGGRPFLPHGGARRPRSGGARSPLSMGAPRVRPFVSRDDRVAVLNISSVICMIGWGSQPTVSRSSQRLDSDRFHPVADSARGDRGLSGSRHWLVGTVGGIIIVNSNTWCVRCGRQSAFVCAVLSHLLVDHFVVKACCALKPRAY